MQGSAKSHLRRKEFPRFAPLYVNFPLLVLHTNHFSGAEPATASLSRRSTRAPLNHQNELPPFRHDSAPPPHSSERIVYQLPGRLPGQKLPVFRGRDDENVLWQLPKVDLAFKPANVTEKDQLANDFVSKFRPIELQVHEMAFKDLLHFFTKSLPNDLALYHRDRNFTDMH